MILDVVSMQEYSMKWKLTINYNYYDQFNYYLNDINFQISRFHFKKWLKYTSLYLSTQKRERKWKLNVLRQQSSPNKSQRRFTKIPYEPISISSKVCRSVCQMHHFKHTSAASQTFFLFEQQPQSKFSQYSSIIDSCMT